MTDSFQHWVLREIREILDRSAHTPPLLLWCDPDRSWLDLLREAAKADGFDLWAPLGWPGRLARVAGARSVLLVATRPQGRVAAVRARFDQLVQTVRAGGGRGLGEEPVAGSA